LLRFRIDYFNFRKAKKMTSKEKALLYLDRCFNANIPLSAKKYKLIRAVIMQAELIESEINGGLTNERD